MTASGPYATTPVIARHLRTKVEAALEDTPVVFLRGPRQTGKSTLAQDLLPEGARYVTFDDKTTRTIAEADMKAFVGDLPHGSVIDEVQRVPELFATIKARVDEDRRPGTFLLTGSADVTAIPSVAESLTGRIELLTLWPFSAAELRGAKSNFLEVLLAGGAVSSKTLTAERDFLIERLRIGGYPEALSRKSASRRQAWFSAYLETIAQRDINIFAEIEGLEHLPQLVELLAYRSSALLNYSELARTLKLPTTTTRRYLSLLRATYILDLLPAWSNNATVRVRKAPKVLLCDSGLVSAIRDEPVTHEALLRDGSLLETFVGMELKKLMSFSDKRIRLSHFREKQSYEVDFVLERGRQHTIGIEVKASTTLSPADRKGLLRLRDLVETPRFTGVVLYGGAEVLPFGDKIWAVPIAALWEGV